jgi:hypothetical protein
MKKKKKKTVEKKRALSRHVEHTKSDKAAFTHFCYYSFFFLLEAVPLQLISCSKTLLLGALRSAPYVGNNQPIAKTKKKKQR